MPRITLVTTEVQRAREADRQVGVDLYDAVIGADIVIIAAPALAGHELAGEGFAFGHGDMRRGAPATTRDRGVEHLFQPILRDGETVEIGLDQLGRAAWRERMWQDVLIPVVAVSLKK